MMKAARIILIVLCAAAISVALNLTAREFPRLDRDPLAGPLMMAPLMVGSWVYQPWKLYFGLANSFPWPGPGYGIYVVSAMSWAGFGLIIAVLAEMRRAGRKVLLSPWRIAALYIPIWLFIAVVVFMGGLAHGVLYVLVFLVGGILVEVPPLLAVFTLAHAFIPRPNREQRRIVIVVSVLLILAGALAVAYYVRQHNLEKALVAWIRVGNDAEVKRLVHSFPCPVNAHGWDGSTPLHCAVEHSAFQTVDLLVSMGADVNARDKRRRTPLHQAAEYGTIAIAEFLLAKGADVMARDKIGATPLHCAACNPRAREMGELLIGKGVDVNAQCENSGYTPLHWAAIMGSKEFAELLIAKGADVNSRAYVNLKPA